MELLEYEHGNEKDILELFQLSFGKEMTVEYWQWRFLNNPFTKDIFIDLMWENNTLVGHYAVSPIEINVGGKIVSTALSMTTMTHPQFGGKRIFSTLAENLYNRLQDKNYSMVWGFPNNNSHYGFNKNLNWRDIAVQAMMTLSLKKIEKNLKHNTSYQCITKNSNLSKNIIDKLNTSTSIVSIHKSEQYINWRYFNNPTANYKFISINNGEGLIIYKVISSFSNPQSNEIDIMDLKFNNDYETLLNLLSAIAQEEEYSFSQFNLWDSLFSENQIILEKIGFKIQSPVTYIGYRPFENCDSRVGDYKNWEIGFSYSDVF